MKTEKNKILILIGIPASGKTTWSKEYVKNNPEWVRVNRDDFRFMLKDQPVCEPKIEDIITKLVVSTTREFLKKKMNVILDATHLRVRYLENIIEEFKYEANIDYRVFDISLKKAIERDNVREKKVGEQVIEKMFDQYKILVDSFHFQPHKQITDRPTIVPDLSKPNSAMIFDLDGTIFRMVNRGPFEWHKVGQDEINPIIVDMVNNYFEKGVKIILVSGRDAICRKETEECLAKFNIQYDKLFMRKEGDNRKDTIIKREIYENEISNKYNVICVIDDRTSVVNMWRKELGLYTLDCNQSGIDF